MNLAIIHIGVLVAVSVHKCVADSREPEQHFLLRFTTSVTPNKRRR